MSDYGHLTMPCCPICDNAIEAYQGSTVIVSGGDQGLAHTMCIEIDEEDEEPAQ